MSTTLPSTENDNKYILMYSVDVMKARIFGAFLCAAQHRKDTEKLTRKMLAEAMCKDEGVVSKLFAAPTNMTIKTIAELCVSLDVELQFALIDRKEPGRVFLDIGMRCRKIHPAQEIEVGATQSQDKYLNVSFKNYLGRSHRAQDWNLNKSKAATQIDNYVAVISGRKHADRKD